jgi:glucose/arabinose dehydrogenase
MNHLWLLLKVMKKSSIIKKYLGLIVRYTEVNGVADPNSRLILIGQTKGSGFPVCESAHTVGDIIFGRDGSLLASAGDGAHYEFPDHGQDLTA